MNEEQIKQIVLQALAELNSAAPGSASTATTASAAGGGLPARPASGAGAGYPKVITQAEVDAAVAAGRRALVVASGTLVTPLAREAAADKGVEIVVDFASMGGGTAQVGCVLGSSYCVECGACVQPAFYERRPWPLAGDLDAMVQRIQSFALAVWSQEPADVRALRAVKKPPMGNLPCVFYANANLFWSGENIQVARELAKSEKLPMDHLNAHLAASLTRHAGRLSKWGFDETIGLFKDVISFLEQGGAKDYRSFAYLCEQLMIAVDRVQSWVDRMIPWNDLDAGVALRPLM